MGAADGKLNERMTRMKMKKLASLCKRRGVLQIVEWNGQLFAGPHGALYQLPQTLPKINTQDELMTVLGYSEKEKEKIMSMWKKPDESGRVMDGVNLESTETGERICDEAAFDLAGKGVTLRGLACEDGKMAFIDTELLGPVGEEASDYSEFYKRRTAGGEEYFVLKDGFDLRAVFMPYRINSMVFIAQLRDMADMCERELHSGRE